MEKIKMLFSPPKMEGGEEAEMRLYGEVVPDYGKWYKEDYPEDKSAADFAKTIHAIRERGVKRLTIAINSPGGDVFQAAAMRTTLMEAGFEKVTMRIDGLCASAATMIASLPGALVKMGDTGSYMIHNPSSITWGTAEDMERDARTLRSIEESMHAMYAARTGKDEEAIKAWMDNETWFNAKEALENGFVDEIIEQAAGESSVAACVGKEMRKAMKAAYAHLPEALAEEEAEAPEENTVCNGMGPTENTNAQEREESMEIRDITREDLERENPGLVQAIIQDAMQAERERVEDIKDMTVPGYEELRDKAIRDGVSATEYNKQIVAAMREKRGQYVQDRANEVKACEEVQGGAAEDEEPSEDDKIKAYAAEMAKLCGEVETRGGGMY